MWQQLARKIILRGREISAATHLQQRSFVSRTLAVGLAAKTINVPTMGDSITEVRVLMRAYMRLLERKIPFCIMLSHMHDARLYS